MMGMIDMNQKITVAAVALVAVGIAAVTGTMAFRNRARSPEPDTGEMPSYASCDETDTTTGGGIFTGTFVFSGETSAPAVSETTVPEETGTTAEGETTLEDIVSTIAEEIQGAITQYFVVPKAPKYKEGQRSLTLDPRGLASYAYDSAGNYYYTDDKACWQKNFGYSQVYDKFAPYTVMYFDTVRVPFTYGDKKWRIQIWKGQYGYGFVGAEIGVYTQAASQSGDHFVCADKEDWLNMEMTLYWDAYRTGSYAPVFTRPYTKYWWCTGFVTGFEDDIRDISDMRLVARITFKDREMAAAFSAAFEKSGFRRQSSLKITDLDAFLQVGNEVAFVWQNIK